MIKQGQEIEVIIEKLGFGGEGISRLDDLVIFVKGALPGQKVKIVIQKKKKNHAQAKVIEILEKAKNEISPICEHFGICGGCKWQNLPYESQLKNKENQVKECLEHLGNFNFSATNNKIDFQPIMSSPDIFSYRNKVEFSFGYQNMRVEVDKDGNRLYFDENPSLGFHSPGKWEEIISVRNCNLIPEKVNKIFTKIKEWCLSQNKSVHNPKTHKGFWRHLLLRFNLKGEILVNLIVHEEIENLFFSDLIELLKNESEMKSFYVTVHKGLNDDWMNGDLKCLYGDKEIYEEILGMKFSISPKSFFQTNSKGAEVLYSKVVDFAKEINPKSILDLYCGTGTIGQILAKDRKETKIIGLELLESAVADAYKNAELNNLKNVEFISGKAEKTLQDVLEKYPEGFDLVIIDPPRSGMHQKALKTLLEANAKNIIYVSCNPSTLARDLRILCDNGYELQKVCPVDMFPHTAHIEVVTKLVMSR